MRLKRLELWWRALWIRILVALMRRAPHERPAWGAGPVRVLFLRHDRAGDMILSTGVMRAIARSQPTIALDVLASPANASILEAADYVANVIVFDKKRLASYLPAARRLRAARYDAVIDCMVTAPSLTTLLLVYASGARYRVGIAGRGNDAAFNVTVPPSARPQPHMVDLLGALGAAFDVDARAGALRPLLIVTPAERDWAESAWGARRNATERRVLVNVSAGTPARLWADANYVAVLRHLRQRHPAIEARVIGAPGESARAQRIAADGGATFVRTPRIRDAFALVATADFVFTPDTSIAHAASAFRTPCVAMYVRGTAERWALYDTPGESVEHPESTLDTLSVERMLRAVDAVWSDSRVSRAERG
ncbi:MAG TPA: glycosyltransferase family 9 protein [Gemmatimonadaceae bacterium]